MRETIQLSADSYQIALELLADVWGSGDWEEWQSFRVTLFF